MILAAALFAMTSQTPESPTERLAWLQGTWAMERNGRQTTEVWMPPAGGTLLGMSRTVADGKTLEYEHLLIREVQGRVEYVATPSNQKQTVFRLKSESKHEVLFENPDHDFPQRIGYKRTGDNLLAFIEGERNGQTRRIEFPYQKVRP